MSHLVDTRSEPAPAAAWQLPLRIPSGAEGVAAIGAWPPEVAPRHAGRTHDQREHHTIFFFLHALLRMRAEWFPATLRKSEAPDFLLECADGLTRGIEISEFASKSDQEWMGATSREVGAQLIPGLGDGNENAKDGAIAEGDSGDWCGDGPEQAWREAIHKTLLKKVLPRAWRNASNAERWLVLYDQVLAPTWSKTRLPIALEVIGTAASGNLQLAIVSDGRVAIPGHHDWIAPPDDGEANVSLTDASVARLAQDPGFAAAVAAAEAEAAAGHVVSLPEVMRSLDAIIETARRARA